MSTSNTTATNLHTKMQLINLLKAGVISSIIISLELKNK